MNEGLPIEMTEKSFKENDFLPMKKVVNTGQYESEWLIENLWPFLRFSGGLTY